MKPSPNFTKFAGREYLPLPDVQTHETKQILCCVPLARCNSNNHHHQATIHDPRACSSNSCILSFTFELLSSLQLQVCPGSFVVGSAVSPGKNYLHLCLHRASSYTRADQYLLSSTFHLYFSSRTATSSPSLPLPLYFSLPLFLLLFDTIRTRSKLTLILHSQEVQFFPSFETGPLSFYTILTRGYSTGDILIISK